MLSRSILKVAYITNIVTPFWCDVALSSRDIGIEFTLLCEGTPASSNRPSHWNNWKNHKQVKPLVSCVFDPTQNSTFDEWILFQLHRIQPDYVIVSSYKDSFRKPAYSYCKRIITIWPLVEQPKPLPNLYRD